MRTLTVVCIVAVLAIAVSGAVDHKKKNVRHVAAHSLHPPMLSEYYDGGMLQWSFGGNTVITDNFSRLTMREKGTKGYLWNKVPLDLEAWQFNATYRIALRKGQWFGDKSGAGIAFWVTDSSPRRMPTSLYGMIDRFKGFGVLVDHTDTVHVVHMDGVQEHGTLLDAQVAKCPFASGEKWAQLNLRYHRAAHMLEVILIQQGYDPVRCAQLNNIRIPETVYIGVTAGNSQASAAYHDVTFMSMYPLNENMQLVSHDFEDDEEQQPSYDHHAERQEKKRWSVSNEQPQQDNNNNNNNNGDANNNANYNQDYNNNYNYNN